MADASLTPIFERLNGVPAYHPMSADTFADWAMEAGDMVTMSRGEDSITSPVSTSRMVWRGQQQITLEATGSKEREAISKISKRKYGRGGGGMTSASYIYHEIADTYNNLRTIIMATESGITTMVSNNYRGLSSYIQQSSSSIDAKLNSYYNGLSSHLNITSSSLNFYIQDVYSSLSSRLSITSSSLSHRISDDYNGLTSYVEQTASSIRELIVQGEGSVVYPSLTDPSGSHEMKDGDIWIQTTGIHSWEDLFEADTDWGSEDFSWEEVRGSVTWVWRDGAWEKVIDDRELATMTDFDRTSDHIRMTARAIETLDGQLRATEASFEVRAQQIESTVIDRTNGLDTRITQTTSSIQSEVKDTREGLSSTITQTASSIRMEVNNNYQGLSSAITQTASSIRLEVRNNYQGLNSAITQTASSIRMEVNNNYQGLSSRIQQTASSIRTEVVGKDGVISAINQTAEDILISASKIALSGTTKINDVFTVISNAVGVSVPLICSGNVDIGSNKVLNLYTATFQGASPVTLTALNLAGVIRSASVSGNTLTLKPFVGEDITFSKATSLSGEWSSGHLTVTASPQGQGLIYNQYIISGDAEDTSSDNNSWYVPILAKSNPNEQTSTRTGHRVIVNATSRYNAGKTQGYKDAANAITWPSAISGQFDKTSVSITYPNTSGSTSNRTLTLTKDSAGAYVKLGSTLIMKISL